MTLRRITHKASIRYGPSYGSGQMTSASNMFPDRLNPILPYGRSSVWRSAMLQKYQPPAGAKNAPDFGQRGGGILNRT
jgi:hypothetical protein